jgi:hypothetical protein
MVLPSIFHLDVFAMYLNNGLLLDPSSEFDISNSHDTFETMGNFFRFLLGCMSSTSPWMTNFLLGLPPPFFYVAFSLPFSALAPC